MRTRARILLKADQADGGSTLDDATIAEDLEVGLRTVGRVRERFVERGFEDCLRRKRQDKPSRERTLDCTAEAHLIALACSGPSHDRNEWTMQLLADELIEVYHRPHAPKRPVVCIAEQPNRLTGETRTPIPAKPGRPKRFDHEYNRNGTANLFLVLAPLVGWRHIEVTARRTAKSFGALLRNVVGQVHEGAEKVVPVTDPRTLTAS